MLGTAPVWRGVAARAHVACRDPKTTKGCGAFARAADEDGFPLASETTGVSGLAERYAAALFDLADERRILDEVASDLRQLRAMVQASADLLRLIRSPILSRDEQSKGIGALAERAGAADFAALLNRFYLAATRALLRHDAVIDKLIGDEVMAFFVRGISGPHYRRRAVEAGLELLRAVGYGASEGPWIGLGAAVNAGVAYVGNVGTAVVDFTALGDTVNVAARMQQHAAAGELLVADGVADDLPADTPRRALTLRGHEQPIEALVLTSRHGSSS